MSDTFSLTWKIENFHLSNRKMDSYLHTPNFQVGLLQKTTWQLLFAPEGIDDPLFMGCSLIRVSSDAEPEIIKFTWKICLIAEGGTVRFERYVESILGRHKIETVPDFIRKSELLPTDTPQNNLTIYCEMKKDVLYSSDLDQKYDLEALSSDLAGLLESGFWSDFKMYCRGEIFNVHKFILLSRWPSICARLEVDISARDDIIMTGIEPSTLRAFLTLLYSGRLHRKDISMELCSYMHEHCCDNLLECFETPVSSLEFVTYQHHEWKQLTWEVGDENAWKDCKEGFFRVIPLEEVYPSEMVIVFGFEKRNGEEWLKLGVFLTGVMQNRPILFDGEISFTNKNTVVCSRKVRQLVESGEEWYLPQLVKKSDLFPNARNSKCVEFNLCICDGSVDTRLISTNIANASRFKEVKDLRKLRMDLLKSTYKKDLKLKVGKFFYDVHSPVVVARSEKFRELIQQNSAVIEIEEFIKKKAADALVHHLYGGRLPDLDFGSVLMLNSVATNNSLASLLEKTESMLMPYIQKG